MVLSSSASPVVAATTALRAIELETNLTANLAVRR
jgi:hypothetical protein